MATTADLGSLPGFRRRFTVTPAPGCITTAVEDDYHCMAVTLRHDGTTITAVERVGDRPRWPPPPAAAAVLVETFVGTALAEAAQRGFKQANCTHLYDLTVLAAAHAGDEAPLT